MAKVYGIDLGTTYSAISTLDDHGMPVIIPNQDDEGSNLLPSAVYFPEGGAPVVGIVAKGQKEIEPERVIEYVKRFIGKENAPVYEFDGVQYGPIEISSLILKQIKAYAEAQGHDVKDVVITCPANFGSGERTATKQAGLMAGLNVLDIVNEPTAAALNYCCHEYNENRKIMVYDLGGGTFDITLFDFVVDENGVTTIDIIKSQGNDHLGGIDWDARLTEYVLQEYATEEGLSVDDLVPEQKRLVESQIEQLKKDLTKLEKKNIQITYAGQATRIPIFREKFELATQELVVQTIDFMKKVLADSGIAADNIDVVLMVGGSTRMPMIMSAVEAIFPGRVRREDPDLAVAKGAALSAGIKWNERIKAIKEQKEVIPPNPDEITAPSNLPTNAIDAVGKELNVPESGFKDKLGRSMGPGVFIDETHYMIDNLLFVGDEMPAEAEEVYGTRVDNQAEIKIRIFENVATSTESKYVTPSVDENGNEQYTDPLLKVKMIGDLRLELPPNSPAGTPIKVVFHSSAAGLEVSATDVRTNISQKVEIKNTAPGIKTQEELKKAQQLISSIETRADF